MMTATRIAVTVTTLPGRGLTLTATRTSQTAAAWNEGGWVTFFAGEQILGTTELVARSSTTATAILTLPSLPAGAPQVTATFEPFFASEEEPTAPIEAAATSAA